MIGAWGAAPTVNLGFEIGASFVGGGGSWSLALDGRGDLPAGVAAAGGRIETSLLVGTVAPCGHLGPLSGCVLLVAGARLSRGAGLADAREVVTPYVAIGGRIAGEWHVFPGVEALSIQTRVELQAPLTRAALVVGDQQVWETGPVSLDAVIGLGWRFL